MINLNSKIKKFAVALILIIFIFTSILSFPTQSKAFDLAGRSNQIQQLLADMAEWAKEAARWASQNAYNLYMKAKEADNWIIRAAADRILKQLTESIVNWINTGFEGNPSFVTDPGKFMQNTADIVVGDMLKGTDLEFLCDPFKLQIKLALGLQYKPFKNEISCSFSSVMGNVNDAMNNFTNGDFINGGGWDSWLQITTVPQNNAMGAMMIAQLEMDDRMKKALDLKDKELSWGSGFMSYYKCTNLQTGDVTYGSNKSLAQGESGPELYDCEITTPGTALVNTSNWANSSIFRKTELANSADAILGAIVNLAVTKLREGLSSQITGSANRTKDTTREDNLAYLQQLNDQYNAQQAQLNPNYVPTNIYSSGGGSGSSGSGSGSGSGSYNSSGSVNFSQNFTDKMSALSAIDNQISIENQYLLAQNNLARLLTATQNAFDSSNCEAPLKDLAIKQITGEYTGTKSLQWNKRDIALATSTANIALNTLNTTKASVSATDNNTAISSLTQNLNGLTRHGATDVISSAQGGALYEQTRIWIADQIDTYSLTCTVSKSGLSEWGIL